MDSTVRTVLEEYQSRLDEELKVTSKFDLNEYLRSRDGYLLGIGAETGKFLNILIKSHRPKTIVEVGTSYGYSTLWLAEAAHAVRGKLITLELSADKSAVAQRVVTKAGLESAVEFVVGDALQKIEAIAGQIDFALIDLWKELYIPAFDTLYPKLTSGAIIAADNMLSPSYTADDAARYRAHVRSQVGIETVTVPIGSGVEVSYFSGAKKE
ncbi:MAG TPA: class I SAM-dependent methyltransferase [Terriglobales bacterium]|nr:class I SAM-dependent methyltransferase [Terriglobales bacterium]